MCVPPFLEKKNVVLSYLAESLLPQIPIPFSNQTWQTHGITESSELFEKSS
jgi:hypothetical protein